MRRRTTRRIEHQQAQLRDGRSAAGSPLGELTATVSALRAAVAKLPAHRRDQLVLGVVRHLSEAVTAAHEEQRRLARRIPRTPRRRSS